MFYQYQHFGLSESVAKEYGKNFNFPAHLHQYFEIITIIKGEMEITIDNNLYTLKKGESVLIFPHQLHSLSSKKSEHILFIFSPETVKAYFSKYSSYVPKTNQFRLSGYLYEKFKKINDDSSIFDKKGFFYSICAEFDKSAEYEKRTYNEDNLLFKIFKVVEENFKTECTLETVSLHTAFSYSYLSRYFKKTTGISFKEYVNQYRISNACYLLNNTDFSVLECAMESGYSSLRSFNRNFKLHTGTTPQEYRHRGI